MTALDRTALVLVIIGAINWGLVGLFQFDLVAALFGGQSSAISRIVYVIVGIAGLYCLVPLFRGNSRRVAACPPAPRVPGPPRRGSRAVPDAPLDHRTRRFVPPRR